ncbi:hypothetical protein B0H10DRAFT_1988381 [Mycena sp. CBHHK59/15]|nr:hypothetical protein B0H10DRAFT_1988381 [Mycena sp. CBHHK59/15]
MCPQSFPTRTPAYPLPRSSPTSPFPIRRPCHLVTQPPPSPRGRTRHTRTAAPFTAEAAGTAIRVPLPLYTHTLPLFLPYRFPILTSPLRLIIHLPPVPHPVSFLRHFSIRFSLQTIYHSSSLHTLSVSGT